MTRGMEEQERGDRKPLPAAAFCSSSRWPGTCGPFPTALKMVTDLQRIGDQAANIAELAILLSSEETVSDLPISA